MCLAIPLRIKKIVDDNRALAGSEDFEMEIGIVLVPDVRPGDHVLVHAGFALEVLSDDRAEDMKNEIDELLYYRTMISS